MLAVASSVANGDAGTVQTLQKMRDLVRARVAHPRVRRTAVTIAMQQSTPSAVTAQIYGIRRFLSERVTFLRDPDGVELLHDPVVLLEEIEARYITMVDCDDVAMLAAALGKAIGIPARFRVVAFGDANAPYSHVWADLFSGNGWVELDTTRPAQGISGVMRTSRSMLFPV